MRAFNFVFVDISIKAVRCRCGFEGALTLLQTGEKFKTTRKRMHGYIGSRAAAARFAELEEIETHRFLLHILDKPEDFYQHIRTYVILQMRMQSDSMLC